MPFDSPDVNLGDLLSDVGTGKSRLPDFQREWKWDDDRIRSLLASISLGYPVGVLMMLEVGGEARFSTRLLAGVDGQATKKCSQLVLDGQQRLTSLYQALASRKVVQTKDPRGKRLARWYYLDIRAALDPDADREDAIVSVPEDRVVRSDFGRSVEVDLSTMERECEGEMFPLSITLDTGAITDWLIAYTGGDPERSQRWKAFYEHVLKNVIHYTVPVIVLKKETPREAVCTVFEKVNTGGVSLDVFELLTATFATDEFRLRDDWQRRQVRLGDNQVLRGVQNTDFLQAVTLLATKARRDAWVPGPGSPDKQPGISCRRRDILALTLAEYRQWAEPVTQGLEWAGKFLNAQRIFLARDVPYRTQLVPLAAIRVALGQRAEAIATTALIRRWYWCGVLGELYGGATETRFARDLADVVAWVEGGPEPQTVVDAAFVPTRLLTLRTRNSAAYKGLYALLMQKGCTDWLYEQQIDLATFHQLAVDIHHVFPKKWCNDHNIDAARRESIVNKTAIAARTNGFISGRAPSRYLPLLEAEAGITAAALDERLAAHFIDAARLRADDFDGYFATREEALLGLIEAAMGKEVPRDAAASATDDVGSFEPEADEVVELAS